MPRRAVILSHDSQTLQGGGKEGHAQTSFAELPSFGVLTDTRGFDRMARGVDQNSDEFRLTLCIVNLILESDRSSCLITLDPHRTHSACIGRTMLDYSFATPGIFG